MPLSIHSSVLNLVLILAVLSVGSGVAQANPCVSAAQTVARATGVPVDVLHAISLTETGRKRGGKMQPWPWTVNLGGKGHWFESRDMALSFADKAFGASARSFDIGCFQINFRWHGAAFASIDDMFDPVSNARYAADFLTRLYRESGDWRRAVGTYHSRRQDHADRYLRSFDRHLAALEDGSVTAPLPTAAERAGSLRVNAFPLLQGGNMRGLASLVPVVTGARPLIAGQGGRLR